MVGRDAHLVCYVENAKNYKIAWIRIDTQTILSMNEMVISRNHRFSVAQTEGGREWHLFIKDVKPSDQAWYMCQINSDPMMSITGYLEIKGKITL